MIRGGKQIYRGGKKTVKFIVKSRLKNKIIKCKLWVRHEVRLSLQFNGVCDSDRTFKFLRFKNKGFNAFTDLLMDCYEG